MAVNMGRQGTGKQLLPKVRDKVEEVAQEVDDDEEEGAVDGQNTSSPFDQMDVNSHELLNVKPDLVKLLHEIDDYQILIPDSVVKFHLEKAGCKVEALDAKLVRLIGLAAQKFASNITSDALRYSVERGGDMQKHDLTMEDFAKVLKDRGIAATRLY
jgi:hypothetical protein